MNPVDLDPLVNLLHPDYLEDLVNQAESENPEPKVNPERLEIRESRDLLEMIRSEELVSRDRPVHKGLVDLRDHPDRMDYHRPILVLPVPLVSLVPLDLLAPEESPDPLDHSDLLEILVIMVDIVLLRVEYKR